jgi:hypothetical protein
MGIRIRVSTHRTESTTKENGAPAFGSYGAGASINFEIDPALLNDPEAFVGKIRTQYQICEAAMSDELHRLKAKANGHASASSPAGSAAGATPPAKQPAARPPANPLRPVAAAEDYDQIDEVPEDDDPPNDGNHLLGWARNQPGDAKNWLIGLGKRLRYPNRILDWSPKQVQTAYRTYREAHRG